MLPNETSIFEQQRDGYKLSTDRDQLNVEYIYRFMSEKAYWAKGKTKEDLVLSIAGSIAVGLYFGGEQVGFLRIVTDCASFAYVMDVFTDESHRGKGLGVWLSGAIFEHPDLATVKVWRMATKDAHKVYEKSGWKKLEHPDWMMEFRRA